MKLKFDCWPFSTRCAISQ